MVKPSELATHAGRWLCATGPDSEIVLSTRIRLARNVDGHPFPSRIAPDERGRLETRLYEWIREADLGEPLRYYNLLMEEALTGQLLMERHLISRELLQGKGDRGVSFSASELLSVMTNEEDHLRIQVIRPGQALEEALEHAIETDRRLEARIPYAYSEDYGYLTACPTNVGTGMRISVMMHLPALVFMDQMDKVFQATSKVGLTVRGFYGEGTKAVGDVIQISNQQTLGRTEPQIRDTLANIVPKIVEYERGVRTHLVNENRIQVEDKIWRAVGLLRYGRKISSEEALNLLSAVRLGASLRILPGIELTDVNELLVITQPAHLQVLKGQETGADERDVARAALLRERFKPESH